MDLCKKQPYYVCLDIESRNLIPKGDVLRDLRQQHGPDFDPVRWTGIARIGLKIRFLTPPFSTRIGLYRLDDGRLDIVKQILDGAEFVTGWNIGDLSDIADGFDINLLSRFMDVSGIQRTFDMMRAVSEAKGTKRRYKFDDVCYTTLGKRKYGKGADAPSLWRALKDDELDTYLVGDLDLEEELCWFAVNNGFVLAPDGKAVFLNFEPYIFQRGPAWVTNWSEPAGPKQFDELARYIPRLNGESNPQYYARVRPHLYQYAISPGMPTRGDLYGILKNLKDVRSSLKMA